jgi:epoxide hydrolase-like predicted phosphatase
VSHDGGYRGLLVDWGGVLTSNVFDSFAAFCESQGLSPDEVGRRFRQDREVRQLLIDLETGALEESDFQIGFGAALGVPAEGLIDGLFGRVHADEEMIGAVRRAREQGVRTGLISNSWGTRRYDRALLGELFDGIVLSGEEGMRKPTPAMYELGAERIGVPASSCVFVDDLPFNLEPAADLGMATVHHVDSAGTVAELERLFGLALR